MVKIRLDLLGLVWICIALVPIVSAPMLLEPIFFIAALHFIISKGKLVTLKKHLVFLLLMLQYPLWNMLRIYLTPEHNYEILTKTAEYEIWVYSALAIIFLTVFFDDKHTASFAKIILPLSVLGTFSLSAYHFFELGDRKVSLFNEIVFETPLYSTTFALILLGFCFKKFETPKLYVFLPVTLVIIMSIVFSGTRGVFLAQVVSVSAGILIYGFFKLGQWSKGLLTAMILGLAGGFVLDVQNSGHFTKRLHVIYELLFYPFTTAHSSSEEEIQKFEETSDVKKIEFLYLTKAPTEPEIIYLASTEPDQSNSDPENLKTTNSFIKVAEKEDLSTSYRLQFWVNSLNKLENNLLWGAGAFIEPYWVQEILPGHLHSHNMYISWLVWGGIFTLTSGLIFIFAPVIVVLVRRNLRTNIAVLLVALLWAASMLFDSFLVHKQFNYVFILLACMSNATISLNRNK